MLPTPSTGHVNFDQVYEPAEDSFLLIDTLASASETSWLSQRLHGNAVPVVVEVGTGSGVVLAFVTRWASRIFGRREVITLGIDVNWFAASATAKTIGNAVSDAKQVSAADVSTGCFGDAILSDLTGAIRPGSIDILIFNPPYVPTENLPSHNSPQTAGLSDFERDSHLLALSYAGGVDGMETTNRLLAELSSVLSLDLGVAYILLCAQNKPEEVKARIKGWPGSWNAETVGESGKKGGWEKLQIVRIWREP